MSGVILIIKRSLRQHGLSSMVTICSVALATGLLMAVSVLQGRALEAFTGGALGYDGVLGARGSALQLVLNSLFHLETSPGNIPWSMYEAVKEDPRVTQAVPLAVGDNYNGFRIVGTTRQMFNKAEGSPALFRLQTGTRFFDPDKREAVIGAAVAKQTVLDIGDVFHPYHGVIFDESMRHAEKYHVVGVLKPMNTPADRVIWIPIEAQYRLSGHVLRGGGKTYTPKEGETIPNEYKEVSAVLLKFHSLESGFTFDMTVNKQGKAATLAWPVNKVIYDFLNQLGWVRQALGLLAFLTAFISAGTILAALTNAMNERRREFAILRALGARRKTVFAAVMGEALVLSLGGAILGYGVYAVIFMGTSFILEAQTGVVLSLGFHYPSLWLTPLILGALGAVAGLLPAWRAYATDVAHHLSPIS